MPMTQEERAYVEAVLQYVMSGQSFCRVQFYGHPILYIWGPKPTNAAWWYEDEASIHVEGRWRLFETVPTQWPRWLDELPEQPMEELARVACRLRRNAIVSVRLGEEAPHLLITFDNGQVLFVNGHHEEFESWEVNAGGRQCRW